MGTTRGARHLLNKGVYAVNEAARLVNFATRQLPSETGRTLVSRDIRRWLEGYTYSLKDSRKKVAQPLWKPELDPVAGDLVLSFKDLLELMFVAAFRRQGVSLQTIRRLIADAVDLVEDPYPLSSPGFRTDGKRILADALDARERRLVFDLESGQQLLELVFDLLPKGIEYEELVRIRWWPLGRDRRVVLDPKRRFGRPIVPDRGIPTATLVDALAAEGGSFEAVAYWYEIDEESVRDAVEYETRLAAA